MSLQSHAWIAIKSYSVDSLEFPTRQIIKSGLWLFWIVEHKTNSQHWNCDCSCNWSYLWNRIPWWDERWSLWAILWWDGSRVLHRKDAGDKPTASSDKWSCKCWELWGTKDKVGCSTPAVWNQRLLGFGMFENQQYC